MPKQPDIKKQQAELHAKHEALNALGRALTTEELVALDPNKVRASNYLYDVLKKLVGISYSTDDDCYGELSPLLELAGQALAKAEGK